MEPSFSETASSVATLAQPQAAYPTIKQSWGVLGWYLLLAILVGVPIYFLFFSVIKAPKTVTGAILTVLVEITLLLILARKAGNTWRSQLRFAGRELPWLYAVLPVLVLAQVTLLSLLEFLHLPNIAESTFRDLVKQPVLALFVMCVAAPVLEELTFRGIVLKGLLKNYAPWVAIGQSALLFGLIHMNPAQIVAASLIGLLLGWLYYRTQSLWLCMAIHALNNLLAFLGISSSSSRNTETTTQFFGSNVGYACAVVVSALVLGLILWRVQQTTHPTEQKYAPTIPEVEPTVEAVDANVSSL